MHGVAAKPPRTDLSPTDTSRTLQNASMLFSLSSPSLQVAVVCPVLPWGSLETAQCWRAA